MRASTLGCRFLDRCGCRLGVEISFKDICILAAVLTVDAEVPRSKCNSDDTSGARGSGGVRYAPRVERAVRGRHGACVASCAEELSRQGLCCSLPHPHPSPSPTQSRPGRAWAPVPEMVHAQHACAREASTPEVPLIIVHPHAPQPVDGEDAGQTRNQPLVGG